MNLKLAEKGLVVSCQARADNPLHGPLFMGAMAVAARDGGASAIRANGPADVAAVKAAGLPVIGIHKVFSRDYPVYITPDFAAAQALVDAGADVVALDCTPRPRAGEAPKVLIRRIREELGAEVFADISTLEEGLKAADWGADYVATTLSGYTAATEPRPASRAALMTRTAISPRLAMRTLVMRAIVPQPMGSVTRPVCRPSTDQDARRCSDPLAGPEVRPCNPERAHQVPQRRHRACSRR